MKKKFPPLTEKDIRDENVKMRVTLYLDLDVMKALKSEARKSKLGYQTLLNQLLRRLLLKD